MLRPYPLHKEGHLLRVEHVTRIYEDGTLALDDVDLEVAGGNFLAWASVGARHAAPLPTV